MKSLKILFAFVLVISTIGCVEEMSVYYDTTPPSTPRNIRTYAGDSKVEIEWSPVYDSDLAGYAIYWSNSFDGKYKLIGTTKDTYIIDYGASNGITTYYAVAAYDYDGNESDLSYDVAYDTPRPEGFGNRIYDFWYFPEISGYNFAAYQITSFDSDYTDFFFENDDGYFYINVWEDTDVQDMGWTNSIYEISSAPLEGWVEQNPGANVKYTRAYTGHTYIIWTWDNHFAKIRIESINENRMIFDWAYQVAEGNIELKINRNSTQRMDIPQKVKK